MDGCETLAVIIDDEITSKVARMIAGEDAVQIVLFLKKTGKATNDQILAETEMPLNYIRKILFKLYNYSIVQCDRLRDKETRWFIFNWRFQPDQIEGFITNMKRRVLRILKMRLEYEANNDFYSCETQECDKYPFEAAMEHVFRCPVCGKTLHHNDNTDLVNFLRDRVEKIEKGPST
jgi:transcription initiation factor TFIIE subunit alpha